MRLIGRAAKGALGLAKEAVDPDRALQLGMSGLIEAARARHESDPAPRWRPGEPLKLLLAGYVGTRNTGADVRVEEMIRQLRHVFGDDHLELSVCTSDPELTRGYFRTARQLHIPQIFHKFLYDTVSTQHGVIACEGSMFKSKFANALSTMMVGALGLAAAEDKIAVGYGGEAGGMDASLRRLVEKHCADTLIICRNEQSQDVLDKLGVPTAPGTDTAWTFEPAPPERAERLLRRAGWDGEKQVVAFCPINPFWWPVKPEPLKAAIHGLGGGYDEAHYKSVYFHKHGPDVDRALEQYLRGMAGALKDFMRDRGDTWFPVLVGMERLDRGSAERLSEILGGDVPLFISDDLEMYEMVALLRRCSLIVSSRYHALVCSMPGLVPSVGVTMDERIRNLMADRGQPELALEVDDPKLDEHLLTAMENTVANAEAVKDGIGRCVVDNLERMGRMGQILEGYVREKHPDFPFPARPDDPFAYLPPLGPTTAPLVQRYR
ncbi:MAG: polysaccharide pyruvyl transferase family protein [Sandaracinaceae bacterium]|nr:polysaccharide pyruvyl transferase family protein [Sandaracinaceae bacterium]